MMYWDTSAILKLYIPERDSGYFLNLIARTEEQIFNPQSGYDATCLRRRGESQDTRRNGLAVASSGVPPQGENTA